MFKRIGIVALLACVTYVVYKEFFEEDSIKTNNDTVKYVDADDVSNTEPESTVDPVTDEDLKEPTIPESPVIDDTIDFEFIQPEFDTYADAEAAKVLVNRCLERNGYITTTYLTHVASIIYWDVNAFQDNYARFHAKSSYGYTNAESFKHIVRTLDGVWILTNDRPIKLNLKELNNDAYRPGENPYIM